MARQGWLRESVLLIVVSGGAVSAGALVGCDLPQEETIERNVSALHTAPGDVSCPGVVFDPVAYCRSLAGYNVIIGTANSDQLTGTSGPDCIVGLGGQDTINGLEGDDIIFAGEGNDIVHGGGGNDQIFGGPGQDQLFGDAGDDILSGEDGDDTIFGGAGNDSLSGGQGQDTLSGDDGDDRLAGGDGDDHLLGGAGADSLDDCLGHNSFAGGAGINTCRGATGASTFTACATTLACGGGTGGAGGAGGAGGGGSILVATGVNGARELVLSGTDVFFDDLSAIYRVPQTGGAPVTFVDAAAMGVQIEDGLDIDGSFLYWATEDVTGVIMPDTIQRVPLTGGPGTAVVSETFTGSPLRFPQASQGFLYNAVPDATTLNDRIDRTPFGGALSSTTSVVSGINLPSVELIRPYLVSCANLFFEDFQVGGASIKVVSPAGGAVSVLATAAAAAPSDIVRSFDTDAASLYFSNTTQIRKMPIGGGPVQTLVNDPTRTFHRLVVDDLYVYWLANSFGPMGQCLDLRVERVSKTGGPAVILVDAPSVCGNDIAEDETSIFWTQSGSFGPFGPGEVRRLGK